MPKYFVPEVGEIESSRHLLDVRRGFHGRGREARPPLGSLTGFQLTERSQQQVELPRFHQVLDETILQRAGAILRLAITRERDEFRGRQRLHAPDAARQLV